MTYNPHRGGFKRVVNTTEPQVKQEKGESYLANNDVSSIADGETYKFAISTGVDEATLVNTEINTSGRTKITIYEGATVTANDTPTEGEFDNINLNRVVADTSGVGLEILPEPTVDTQGTRLATGAAGGVTAIGNETGTPGSIVAATPILKPDTVYVYELENISGSEVQMNIGVGYTIRREGNFL